MLQLLSVPGNGSSIFLKNTMCSSTVHQLFTEFKIVYDRSKREVPYILESNPHPFYSFRGLKNQMRIRIECGLDSRSRAGFWKNDRAGVRAVRTIQLFIILFIILYNILKYL
jgi:hypothetical protein